MVFQVGQLEASSAHLLADLIELIAALSLDGRAAYRPDDITSIIRDQPDFEDHEPRNLDASIDEAWPQLEYRGGKLGNAYPFTIRDGALRTRARLAPPARIYRFLLACSRLRSFERPRRAAWAESFTRLSREVLLQLMPQWAEVRIFDANSDDRRNYFGTDLRKALLILGRDLATAMVNEAECAAQDAAGDAKIDLVAVAKWDDPGSGIHAILGQCAARETEWPRKRLEAHPASLRGLFSFLSDPVNALFIPVLYRDTNGAWIMQTPGSGCLLVDRLRMLYLLNKRGGLTQLVGEQWFQTFEQDFGQVAAAIVATPA